jgi:hypothetical protein
MEGVIDALIALASQQRNVKRGVHNCEFCDEESPVRIPSSVDPGGSVSIGMGEIHVRGKHGVYSAPSLIVHYVLSHGCVPPLDFQVAAIDAWRSVDGD